MLTTELDLRSVSQPAGAILLRVEVAVNNRLPLVVVWYRDASSGNIAGTRLDVEKRVFLDHFSSESEERRIAGAVSDLVNNFRDRRQPASATESAFGTA